MSKKIPALLEWERAQSRLIAEQHNREYDISKDGKTRMVRPLSSAEEQQCQQIADSTSETECPDCGGWPGEADGSCPKCIEALNREVGAQLKTSATRDAACPPYPTEKVQTAHGVEAVELAFEPATIETRDTLKAIHDWIEDRMRAYRMDEEADLDGKRKLQLAKLLREETQSWFPIWAKEILEEAAEAAKRSIHEQGSKGAISEDAVADAVRVVGNNRSKL